MTIDWVSFSKIRPPPPISWQHKVRPCPISTLCPSSTRWPPCWRWPGRGWPCWRWPGRGGESVEDEQHRDGCGGEGQPQGQLTHTHQPLSLWWTPVHWMFKSQVMFSACQFYFSYHLSNTMAAPREGGFRDLRRIDRHWSSSRCWWWPWGRGLDRPGKAHLLSGCRHQHQHRSGSHTLVRRGQLTWWEY